MRVGDAKAAAQLQAMVADMKMFYDHQSLRKVDVVLEWFGMAFILEMSQKVEMKAFFIGGSLMHIISTTPIGQKLKIAQAFKLTPLSHLS